MVSPTEIAQTEPTVGEGPELGEARSMKADVWRRFRRNRLAMVGLVIIVILVLTAIFADFIAPYSITERDSGHFSEGPSAKHWFGTDRIGRDIFSRVVYALGCRCASACPPRRSPSPSAS